MTAVLGGNGHLLIDDILDETAVRVCIYITSNLLELLFFKHYCDAKTRLDISYFLSDVAECVVTLVNSAVSFNLPR